MKEAEELLVLFGGGRRLGSVEGTPHLLDRLVHCLDLPYLAANLDHCVVDVVPHSMVLRKGVEEKVQAVG